jgi:hypothetical protein
MLFAASAVVTRGTWAASADVVVPPPKPLTVKLAAGTTTVDKSVAIRVLNAASEPAGATVRLLVSDGDCPAGTVLGTADFGKKQAGTPDTTTLLPGKKGKATVRLRIAAAAFTSVAPKIPARCTVQVTASVLAPAGSDDRPGQLRLSRSTSSMPTIRRPSRSPGRARGHEALVITMASPGRSRRSSPATRAAATRSNARRRRDCTDRRQHLPAGMVGGSISRSAGAQASTKVRAGKRASAKLDLVVDASTMPPAPGRLRRLRAHGRSTGARRHRRDERPRAHGRRRDRRHRYTAASNHAPTATSGQHREHAVRPVVFAAAPRRIPTAIR